MRQIPALLIAVAASSPVDAPRSSRTSISPAAGASGSTRTCPNAAPGPTSATTSACRSTTPRVCAPTRGTPAKWTMPERQCEPHPADYAPRGPASMRISSTVDPVSQDVISWHTTLMWMLPQRTIYMDGARPAVGLTRSTPGRDSRPASGKATC